MGGGKFQMEKNGSRNKKSSKTKSEIRAENWRENKVNLPTMVSTGTEKKNPISAPPNQDSALVGFCIAEVVGPPT